MKITIETATDSVVIDTDDGETPTTEPLTSVKTDWARQAVNRFKCRIARVTEDDPDDMLLNDLVDLVALAVYDDDTPTPDRMTKLLTRIFQVEYELWKQDEWKQNGRPGKPFTVTQAIELARQLGLEPADANDWVKKEEVVESYTSTEDR